MRIESLTLASLGIMLAMTQLSSGQTLSGSLVHYASVSKSAYLLGEPVEMRLMTRNDTRQAVTLTFTSSQRFEFIVRNRAGEVWRWSHGKRFLAVIQTVTLDPGQTREYVISWDQRDSAGAVVQPGAFEAIATFLGTTAPSAPATNLTPVRFSVLARASSGGRLPVEARASRVSGYDVGDVLVGGNVALRIRATAGGWSPFQRAEMVADRLRRLLASGLDPERLAISNLGGQEAVVWDGALVVTADQRHARLNNTTPVVLARQWRDTLAKALVARR